jgi:hypothetical protein
MMRRAVALLVATALLLSSPSPATAEAPPAVDDNAQAGPGCNAPHDPQAGIKEYVVPYPFDVSRIRKALERRQARSGSVRVLVVDNGFAGYSDEDGPSKNFPEVFFYAHQTEGWDPTYRPLKRGAKPDAWRWGHGTHVTGVVLGGMYGGGQPGPDPGQPAVRKLFFNRTGLPDSVLSASTDWLDVYVAPLKTATADWDAREILLIPKNTAIPVEVRMLPHIINMSLVYSSPDGEKSNDFKFFPNQFPDSLMVVSAGNGRRLLKDGAQGIYPAMSSTSTGNLLVVGSHDMDLGKSEFSNHHPDKVTLAAPGCAIWSWVSGDSDAEPFNGTSQAAAIVSFGAALLRSRWAALPNDLRERLIVSSRYSDALARGCEPRGCVRWGSVLDIEMALYLDADAVEYCVAVDGDASGDCPTRIALGRLEAIPEGLTTCIQTTLERNDGGETSLPPSSGVRITSAGRYQIIYRKQGLGDGETLASCAALDVEKGLFKLKTLKDQPDGAIEEELELSPLRVKRVVTRSIFPRN